MFPWLAYFQRYQCALPLQRKSLACNSTYCISYSGLPQQCWPCQSVVSATCSFPLYVTILSLWRCRRICRLQTRTPKLSPCRHATMSGWGWQGSWQGGWREDSPPRGWRADSPPRDWAAATWDTATWAASSGSAATIQAYMNTSLSFVVLFAVCTLHCI